MTNNLDSDRLREFRVLRSHWREWIDDKIGLLPVADSVSVERFIIRAAKYLAARHGVDYEKIREILHKTVEPGLQVETVSERIESAAERLYLCFFPYVGEALEWLPPDDAIRLFQDDELTSLMNRLFQFMELSCYSDRLMSIGELADSLLARVQHMRRDQDDLISTGYSRCIPGEFEGPQIFPFRPRASETLTVEPEHAWPESGEATLPHISKEDADRLERIRPKLFDLNVRIYESLSTLLQHSSPDILYDTCMGLITDCLRGDEPEFLLRMDDVYVNHDIQQYFMRADSDCGDEVQRRQHGLTYILTKIEECEQELSIGVYSRTHKALGPKIVSVLRPLHEETYLYFQCCALIGRRRLDEVMNNFLSLCDAAQDFHDEFWRRANRDLNENTPITLVFSKEVIRKYARTFSDHMTYQMELAAAHLRLMGKLPNLQILGATSAEESRPAYLFRKDGDFWTVAYDGLTKMVRDSDGMAYIAYLLEHSGTNLHVRELYAIFHPMSSEGLVHQSADIGVDEIADGYSPDDWQSLIDKQDDAILFAAFRKQRDELQRQIREAITEPDLANHLQMDLDNLKRLISSEFGLDGSSRKKDDPNKKAYDKVSKAMRAATKIIREYLPPLAEHLNAISYDTYTYKYSPEPPVPWQF